MDRDLCPRRTKKRYRHVSIKNKYNEHPCQSMNVLGALGKGVGSESPLARVIEKYNPEKAYIVVTKESLPRVKDLAAQLGPKYEELEITPVILETAENPLAIFRTINEIINDQIDVVDITAGTKAIAAALFLLAVIRRAKVTYVTGTRDPMTGRVISGTEEVLEYDASELAEKICNH